MRIGARSGATIVIAVLFPAAALSQSSATPPTPSKFEVADVQSSAQSLRQFMTGPYVRGPRYELRSATMVDLIRTAYSVDFDKVLGGPDWVEFARFDIRAIAPSGGLSADAQKGMLKALLADRFKLAVHTDSKPFPAYSLTLGKNPKLKEASGPSDTPGCTFRVNGPPPSAAEAGNGPVALTFMASCHGTTIAGFANSMRGFAGPSGPDSTPAPIADNTGLTGLYDIDLKFTPEGFGGLAGTNGISLGEALDKQLGLKLETVQVPMPVIVVDSVNRKATENAPDVARNFPAFPTEFEVASLKPATPIPPGGRAGRIGPTYQNDRVNLRNNTLKQLINLAWDINSDDQVVGMPKFADTDRYDVMAKAPAAVVTTNGGGGRGGPADIESYRPMYRALLIDRFQMKVHYETRPVNAYTLMAGKPKLQKADPANRKKCYEGPGPDGKDPRKANPQIGRLLTCQNLTMAEFAALLPGQASGYLKTAVQDATGIDGAWDFTLNFSGAGLVNGAGIGRAVEIGQPGAAGPTASDPTGGLSLFDAIGKQLGLKLELQKRPMPVLVIDHIEQKPTEN